MVIEHLSKSKKILLIIIGVILLLGISYFVELKFFSSKTSESYLKPISDSIQYKNTQYGFTFSLPKSWTGYSVIEDKWNGDILDAEDSTENAKKVSGPEILIRHPLYTTENLRQDIPIMVFTFAEWNLIQSEKLAVSAAPIGPSELGRNSQYVFALPARYNFAYPIGYEEVDEILQNHPLSTNL